MTTPTLLIVDDEKTTRDGFALGAGGSLRLYLAEDAKAAMDLLEANG